MVHHNSDESFWTMCGITEECSNDFFEHAKFAPFGDKVKTTCKKCLAAYEKAEEKHDQVLKNLSV